MNKIKQIYYRYGQALTTCFLILLEFCLIVPGFFDKNLFWNVFAAMLTITIAWFGLEREKQMHNVDRNKVDQQLKQDKSYKYNGDLIKFKKHSTKQIIICILIADLILIATLVSLYLLHIMDASKMTMHYIVYAVVFAPALEEVIYRQQLFNCLKRFGIGVAAIADCFIFTIIHTPNSLFLFIIIFIRACILLYVYLYSNQRLVASWSVHVVNNLTIVIMCLLTSGIKFI